MVAVFPGAVHIQHYHIIPLSSDVTYFHRNHMTMCGIRIGY